MDANGVAVVTGAGRGIGRAVAIELAQRGFDVVATMRDPADGAALASEAGPDAKIRAERLDVNDASTMNMPPGLRVLVNNAGVESDNLPLEVMPADAWRAIFETNVFGLVEVTKHAIPLMRDAGGGVICNVTSSSVLAPVPFLGAYRASKAAVGAIGESLQAELAPFGIRVLEIMPGPIETDMLLASDKPAAAIEHARYRAQAEQLWEGRQRIRGMYTPAAEAARRIADAILDDAAPLRAGCDDMSEGMLTAWRNAESDEAWFRPLLASFGAGWSERLAMITGLAHTAVCVTDVDAAVEWYRDVLGLTVLSPPYRMEGPDIERDMGELVPSPVVVKAAIVGVPDDSDRVIEVIAYPNAPGRDRPADASVVDHGYTHIALLCDDVVATRADLEAKGVRFLVDGVADVAGVRTTWIADPWNNVFILVEKVRRPDRPYYRQY